MRPRLHRHLVAIASALVLMISMQALPASGGNGLRVVDAARARAVFASMQHYFYLPADKLYRGTYPPHGRHRYSLVWPFSQALAATVSVAADARGRSASGAWPSYRTLLSDNLAGLGLYWKRTPPAPGYAAYPVAPVGPGGARYYDDNVWLGRTLLRAHALLGQRRLLDRAQAVFRFVRSGWDENPRDACPGGVYFFEARHKTYRATTSTAPAAELAAELYSATGNSTYRVWAMRTYAWMNRCLRDGGGLYADHINADGAIEPTRWSYNQGSMIGAGVLLWRITGKRRYLEEAQRTARKTLSYVSRPPKRELSYLMAIYFDNLRLLDSAAPDPRYRAVAEAYADRGWQTARDPHSGLVRFHQRPFSQLLEQAALVRIYADLAAWPSS
jgi:hypothetical protein